MSGRWAHSMDLEVCLRDTDAMGHVNNAVYLSYLELARQGYWRLVAPEQRYDEVPFVLAHADLAFRSPSHAGDSLRVFSRTAWMGRTSIGMEAVIRDVATDRVVVESMCVLVIYDYETRAAVPIPPSLRARLEAVEGGPLPERPSKALGRRGAIG